MTNDQQITATYYLDASDNEAEALAESILIEQTVETPLRFAGRFPFVREHMMGEIASLEPSPKGGTIATLHLPTETASVDTAQFLNVLFGNVSLHEKVRLIDFEIPESLAARFPGPRFGVAGLRERLGVYDRAITATALKPVGLSLDELGRMCQTLAEGGIDLIKDDHYLANQAFCGFEDRVRVCREAALRARLKTGHRAVYVPNLSGSPQQILHQATFARHHGIKAVMLAPMLAGLPFFKTLVEEHLHMPVLAHPSFAGSTRIDPPALFGKLFRLFGADAVIFANYGGRFSYSKEVCIRIAETARAPWHRFKPAAPVPAGGMTVERSRELLEAFGQDTMLLIGGSLLDTDDLLKRARMMVESVANAE